MKFIIPLLLFSSINVKAQFQKKDFIKLNSLEGEWMMKTKKGSLVEQWIIVNDSVMTSKSFRIIEKDTISQETVILKFSNGAISYSPTVPNQNQGNQVSFLLNEIKDGKFIFQNMKHDFPKQIQYELYKNQLKITISGDQKEILFNFERSNDHG